VSNFTQIEPKPDLGFLKSWFHSR